MKESLRQDSLRNMRKEAAYSGAMHGISNSFLAPFAIFLGAGPLAATLIQTLPNFIASIPHLYAPKIAKLFADQRSYLVTFVILHAAIILTFPAVQLLASHQLAALVLLVTIAAIVNLLTWPVWTAYMGDLVPEQQRSTYMARRNALFGGATFLGMIAGAAILGFSTAYFGFVIIFVFAALFRLGSARTFAASRSQEFNYSKDEFTLKRFLKRMPKSDFGKFVRFIMSFRAAMYIAVPFFVIYQLNILKFTYTTYALLIAAFTLSSIIGGMVWRSIVQLQGNQRVLIVSSFIVALLPLLWLSVDTPVGVLLINIIAGFAAAGFEQSQNAYILESTTAHSRMGAAAFYNLFVNAAIVMGSALGLGVLALMDGFSYVSATPFLILFAASGIFRIAVWFRYRRTMSELRFLHIQLKFGELIILPQQAAMVRPVVVPPTARTTERKIAKARHNGDYMNKLTKKEREYYTQLLINKARKSTNS